MGGNSQAKEHPYAYLYASSLSAMINYPLWRASAMGQSGFRVTAASFTTMRPIVEFVPVSFRSYLHAFAPPYKGMLATIAGMTWARAAIFWGSDIGKDFLQQHYSHVLPPTITTLTPPLVTSVAVQCINQPVVRASITIQNPESDLRNIRQSIRYIYNAHGLKGLWHGTNAGILKTVPKYCTAIVVKDYMEHHVLPSIDPLMPIEDTMTGSIQYDLLLRSAFKSASAGVAGALLTNPLDVIRNEMFKTNLSLMDTVRSLKEEMGYRFVTRGMGKNLVAVSIPVASTIFFTDMLIQFNQESGDDGNGDSRARV